LIFIFRNIIKTLLLALSYSFIVNSQHYTFNRNSALQFFVDAMLWSPISHQFLVAADSRDLTFWYEIEWRETLLIFTSLSLPPSPSLARSLSLSLSLNLFYSWYFVGNSRNLLFCSLFCSPLSPLWADHFELKVTIFHWIHAKKYFFEFDISCVA
jgi:hypothetical protein